jgi:NADP-dependent 3-hydroxy acid dehydrogenase YdfG
MPNDVKNNTVLITGGTSGYGKAMAKVFHAAGAKVIIAARHKDALEETAKEIGGIDTIQLDVTDHSQWQAAYATVLERYKRLDILINNAGGGVAIKNIEDQSKAEIDNAISLNLTSIIYAAQIFAPLFKKQKGGTIINVASVCATHAWPTWSVYAAAKAGVLNFSKGLYTELQPFGIRVSCIIPAAASTGFQRSAGIGEGNNQLSPQSIADTALYIASLPQNAVVEDVTVWGIDQVVSPL